MAWIIIFLILGLWIAIGSAMLWWFSRPVGKEGSVRYLTGQNRVVGLDINDKKRPKINVVVEMTPPVLTAEMDDLDIIFLLDNSGSMGQLPGSALWLASKSIQSFIRLLPDNIQCGLITFNHESEIRAGIGNCAKVNDRLSSIEGGGGTAIDLAFDRCLQLLSNGRSGVKKTIILLSDGGSDKQSAYQKADLVKQHAIKPEIFSVGVGYADEELLQKVATQTEEENSHFFYVKTPEELGGVFNKLASRIAGEAALYGELEETPNAPFPFEFWTDPKEIPPSKIKELTRTETGWSFPIFNKDDEKNPQRKVLIKYKLKPYCYGWYSVADLAQVHWEMPDLSNEASNIPKGPYVLIMPSYLVWASLILNPLAWTIWRKIRSCYKPEQKITTQEALLRPEQRDYPPIAKLADVDINYPELRPALIIGMGKSGEQALVAFKSLLQERYVDTTHISLLSIRDPDAYAESPIAFHDTILNQQEKHIVNVNLRGYLEENRDNIESSLRNWIPVDEFLSDVRPPVICGDDRRKGRLALLLNSTELQTQINNKIQDIVDHKGTILLVANSEDTFASGIFLEVAHICSSLAKSKLSINAILGRGEELPRRGELVGFVRELSRITALRGEEICSDRDEDPQCTSNLIERVMVYNDEGSDYNKLQISELQGHFIWQYLLAKKLAKQFSSTGNAECHQLLIKYCAMLPKKSFWHWAESKIIYQYIHEKWFHPFSDDETKFMDEQINSARTAFWEANALADSKEIYALLIKKLQPFAKRGNFSGYLVRTDLSFLQWDIPPHQIVDECNRYKKQFLGYFAKWAEQTITNTGNANSKNESLPLRVLHKALLRIEQDFQEITRENKQQAKNNPKMREHLSLLSQFYKEYQQAVEQLRNSVEDWATPLFGGFRKNMDEATPAYMASVANDIKDTWGAIDGDADNIVPYKTKLNDNYDAWTTERHDELSKQMSFVVRSTGKDSNNESYELALRCFNKFLFYERGIKPQKIHDFIKASLKPYRETILAWPDESWFKQTGDINKETIGSGSEDISLGKHADKLLSDSVKNINNDDDSSLLVLASQQKPLQQVFETGENEAGIYNWSEEYNADLLARKMHIQLHRQVSFQANYRIVSLCRDLQATLEFILHIVEGRISVKHGMAVLVQNQQQLQLGDYPRDASLDDLYKIMRTAILIGKDRQGKEITKQGIQALKQTIDVCMTEIDKSLFLDSMSKQASWQEWRDFMEAVLLYFSDK